jgi:hypothetical protein
MAYIFSGNGQGVYALRFEGLRTGSPHETNARAKGGSKKQMRPPPPFAMVALPRIDIYWVCLWALVSCLL